MRRFHFRVLLLFATLAVGLSCGFPEHSAAISSSAMTVRLAEPAAAGAKLTFRRVFKSSTPEFIELSIREDSDDATYEIRQLDDDPGAARFQLSSALRSTIFALTAQLNHFPGPDLDVHRKIANLTAKTVRWDPRTDT